MGLIKSSNIPASAQPFSMRDIENQARALLARAQQRAEQLLAAAQHEAEDLKKQAYANGLAEGRKDGLAKGLEEGRKSGHQQALTEHRARLSEVVGALTSATSQLDAARTRLEAEAIREVVELAIAIARRVTKRQGMLDPSVVQANAAEAMKLVVDASDVRIAVHPRQKQVLADALPRLQIQFPALKHVELVEDDALAPGGCRVFSRQGQVDAALDTQLDRIVAELLPAQADQEPAKPQEPAP
jgi:flagellar assembly protein FliH